MRGADIKEPGLGKQWCRELHRSESSSLGTKVKLSFYISQQCEPGRVSSAITEVTTTLDILGGRALSSVKTAGSKG